MVFTLLGIVMFCICVPRKAYWPIDSIPSGNTTYESLLSPSNAELGTELHFAPDKSNPIKLFIFLILAQSSLFRLPVTFKSSTSSNTLT